jgi:hypothetical protein
MTGNISQEQPATTNMVNPRYATTGQIPNPASTTPLPPRPATTPRVRADRARNAGPHSPQYSSRTDGVWNTNILPARFRLRGCSDCLRFPKRKTARRPLNDLFGENNHIAAQYTQERENNSGNNGTRPSCNLVLDFSSGRRAQRSGTLERGGPDHGALEREQGQLPESSLELLSISNQPHISNEVPVHADSQPESMLEESGIATEENGGGPSTPSNSESAKKRTGFAFDIPRSESRREDSLRLNPQPNTNESSTPAPPLDSQQDASKDPEQEKPRIPPISLLRKSKSFDYTNPRLRIPPCLSRRSLRSVQLPASIAEEEPRQEEETVTQTAEEEPTHEEMGLEIALSFAVSGLQVSRFTPMADVEAVFRGTVSQAPGSMAPESSGEWLAGGFGGMPEGADSRAGRNGNGDSRGSGTGEIIRDEHSTGADGDRNRNREEDGGPIASAEATAEPAEQARPRPKKSFLAKVKRLFRRRNQDVS